MLGKNRPRLSFNHPFTLVLFISIAIHITVLTQLNWKIKKTPPKEKIFEVELIYPKKIKPIKKIRKIIKPKVKPIPKKLVKAKRKIVRVPIPKAKIKTAPPKKKVITKPIIKPSLRLQSSLNRNTRNKSDPLLSVGNKKLKVPKLQSSKKEASNLDIVPDIKPSDQQISAKLSNKISTAKIKDLDAKEITSKNKTGSIDSGIGKLNKKVSYKITQINEGAKEGRRSSSASISDSTFIEGEIREREIIFKPDPPQLDIEKSVTITLKFTVLPNGEVDQIFPVRKAELELERIAMKLLRQYRFSPLFANADVQEGLIHFTIHRKR